MLLGSFILIFSCSSISQSLLNKYPFMSETDCQDLVGYDNPEIMLKLTILEYKTNSNLEKQDGDVSYSGYV